MAVRGRLRIYLGAAPGVGKTVAMLDEGHRRSERGTDVVVAFVETHSRQHTASRLDGLELLPRARIAYRGVELEEMDLAAVLARHPEVALVDELAHTNAPGSQHAKRWEDVEALLHAGIDVISTLNVQHLESLNDVVAEITGVPQHETVPDRIVRAADQIELVDMVPEALRRRMAHGNIYAAEKVDAALGNYFRVGNLTALRELALIWLADSVEEGLRRYRQEHGIETAWETRERVIVALTGGPEGDTLLRRAARIAARASGGEVMALHVGRSDGLAGSSPATLTQQRLLVESLGGTYHSVISDDTPQAILEFARANNATQIVLGASRRSVLSRALTGPGTGMTITRLAGPIDVHMVGHDYVGRGRVLPQLTGGLTPKRRLYGLLLAIVLLAILTPLCTALRGDLTLASDVLLFLATIVAVSIVGGFYPAMAAALAAALLLNFYFVPPLHHLSVSSWQNVLVLVVFVAIAASVSRVVDVAARHDSEAARAGAEAETLTALAGSLLRGEQALPALLDRVRETFAMTSAALLHLLPDGSWQIAESTGAPPPPERGDANVEVPIGDDLILVLRGRSLPAEDERVLGAFAAQVAVAFEQRELTATAAAAQSIAATDRVRTALLNAVSHDLRTPLAAAKAAISSLTNRDVVWSEADHDELLQSADTSLDRLTALLTNLLDLSRLEAGALPVALSPVSVADVISRALDHVRRDKSLDLAVPDDLPDAMADAGLLERVIANLVDNAARYTPDGSPVRVAASRHERRVQVRVIDRGPGIPEAARSDAFTPFQRLDDRNATGPGVGLGLAIARGFTEAMGGQLSMEETPGGGLTAIIDLPATAEVSEGLVG